MKNMFFYVYSLTTSMAIDYAPFEDFSSFTKMESQ